MLPLVAGVAEPGGCERVAGGTVSRFGRVDALVNNAGRGMRCVSESFPAEPTRFWETYPETWRMVVDTNVNGPFVISRAVVPSVISRGSGSTVNASMNHETMKRRGFPPYGPSEAVLESEAVIRARDLEGTGARVNVLLPGGATETGMVPAGLPESVRPGLLRPGVVAGPAVCLASDGSRHLTGHRIVDTGWSPEDSDGRSASEGLGTAASS